MPLTECVESFEVPTATMAYNLTENQKSLARWVEKENSKQILPETFQVSFLSTEKCLFVQGIRKEGEIGSLDFSQVTPGSFQALAKDQLVNIEAVSSQNQKDRNATHIGLETIRVTILGRLSDAVQSNFGKTTQMLEANNVTPRNGEKTPDRFDTASDTYIVIKKIGEGGSGIVFEVTTDDEKHYALKCLKPDSAKNSKRKRFRNELGFSKNHSHPNLIEVVDSGVVNWKGEIVPFYVMPFMPSNLRQLLLPSNVIAPENKLKLFGQILDGVEAAHLLGVVHRDLKPENILYDPKQDRITIADFGIAAFADELMITQHETKTGEMLCNRHYLAPEQHSPDSKADRRADIFALGLILNELFTASVPYGNAFKKIASVAPSFGYLDTLVDQMIQNDPNGRFSDISSIKRELIGRQNVFIQQQRLDHLKTQVVPRSTADNVLPVEIVGLDAEGGTLILNLNRPPEDGWKHCFQNLTLSGMTVIGPCTPQHYLFAEQTVKIGVNHEIRQEAVNFFKKYSSQATEKYQARLNREAPQREEVSRAEMERQIQKEEQRQRLLDGIRF